MKKSLGMSDFFFTLMALEILTTNETLFAS